MKIDPSASAIQQLRTPGLTRTSSQSFKSFLPPEPAINPAGDERAFSFAERGVLNTSGRTDAAPGKVNARGSRAQASEGAAQSEAAYAATAATPRLQEAIQSAGRRVAEVVGKLAPRGAESKTPAQNAALPSVVAARSATESAARTGRVSRGAAPDAFRPLPTPSTSAASVTLFEAQGAVQVVVAAPGLGARQVETLRKAVADIVDEFGMELSELHLNGSPVEPFPQDLKGGPHGPQPG